MTTEPTDRADAPVPLAGTEQAADQVAKQQQPPPQEPSTLDTIASVVDGVCDVADVTGSILDIFS